MQLHPREAPRTTKSHAELAMWRAFSRCTLPWTVFHSLRLRTRTGWEGEGDFVVCDPARGLLVLEVKGGAMELRDGRWFQNGHPLDTSPREQAQGFVRRLVDEVKHTTRQPVPFGVACVFPDCDFSEGPQAGDLRGLVLGRRDLNYLDEVLPSVMERAIGAVPPPPTRRWLDALRTLWGDTWVPTVKLADRVSDAAERAVALDEKQYTVLEYAGQTRRALVEGPAGSGKTLVAMELCRRRARAGLRTQYLCFTDALARAVAAQFAAEPLDGPRPQATSVRQLAVDLLRKQGHVIPPPDKAFWDEVGFTAAADALPPEGERPDMVVVDEAQDFEPNDWLLIEQLAQDRGLWVFRDARQAFWVERTLPESVAKTLGATLSLPTSYRCPSSLAAFANAYVDGSSPARPPEAELRLVLTRGDEAEAVRHEVERLRRAGAKPEDLVIVSLSGQTKSALFRRDALGTTPLRHADAPDAAQHAVVETFLRFKGLERPFVIVTELGGRHVTKYETRMHIALTRATVQALVVTTPELAAADPRLASLVP
jgi:hypothetical protein